MAEENNKFGNAWEKIKDEWERGTDKTKESWDSIVDRVIDGYRGAEDWTDDKINEAKGYFKGRFGH
jgi:uncharacterized protein YpuA (DUF1002 family)